MGQEQKRMPAKQKKRKKGGAIWVLLVLLLIATTGFTLYLNRDNPTLRAFFSGVEFQMTDAGNNELALEKTEKYCFEGSKDGVVMAQAGVVSILSPSLGTAWEVPAAGENPVVKTSGGYVLSYSMDASGATVVKDGHQLAVQTDDTVITGSINKNGYFVLVTEEKGFQSQIIVYDPAGAVLYKWHSADSYVIDVDISPDNTCLAAATLDLSKDVASGGLMLFHFSQEKPFAGQVMEGNLLLEVQFINRDTLLAIGDTASAGFDAMGNKLWDIDYGGKPLITYDISSNGNAVFAFREQDTMAGGSQVKIYGANGKQKGEYQSQEPVTGVDAVENDVLLTQARKLTLISARGGELKNLDVNRDIQDAVLFHDRKNVLVVSGSAAQVLRLK